MLYHGIYNAANSNWSKNTQKNIFIFGDAPAKDTDFKETALAALRPNGDDNNDNPENNNGNNGDNTSPQTNNGSNTNKANGIQIFTFYQGNDNNAIEQYNNISSSSGGSYIDLNNNANQIGNIITDIVNTNGDDTYIYNLGDSHKTIKDYGGYNVIKFGIGISKEDLIIKKSNKNGVQICFKNNMQDLIDIANENINSFEFANGDKLSFADIQALPLYASDESETIYGYNDKANIINALGGNDTICGGNGNDTITGGTGNDNLQGGYGNDTYIFSKGDGVDTIVDYGGSDTIKFNDFNQDDIKIKRELASLIITSKISDDKITIQNFFDTNTNNPIEKIIFKDSSEWNLNEILKNAPLLGTDGDDKFYLTPNDDEFDALSGDDIIHAGNGNDTINGGNGNDTIYAGNGDDNVGGDDGDDTLYGNNGNDTLIGGTGNDTLEGGYGDDTYIFNLGDGADTISESGGVDTIKFGEGISKEEITFKRISNDLVLKYGADESVKINSYFSNNNYKVEKVELDSGEFITSSQIDKIIEQVNTYAKDNGITSFTNDDMRNNSAMMQIVMSGWGN